jgi:hypothetical protein
LKLQETKLETTIREQNENSFAEKIHFLKSIMRLKEEDGGEEE